MKKLIFILVALTMLDTYGVYYLSRLKNSKKDIQIEILDDNLLYQINNIVLNDINEFNFKKYFNTTSFNDLKIKYEFINEKLLVENNNMKYYFEYEINEPKIIEKTIIKEIEKNVYINDDNSTYMPNDYIQDEYFYVNQEHMSFDLNTEFEYVKECLRNNINTTLETCIDYSHLNTSQIGQYTVKYIADEQEIEIIVEIM